MSKITFITGGASSGKSRWAVSCLESCDNVMYMYIDDALDRDIAGRIEYNCKNRGIEWDVVTGADNLVKLVEGHKFAILDNLCAYVNREVLRKCPEADKMTEELQHEIQEQVKSNILELMNFVKEANGVLYIISTEISYGSIPYEPEQVWFREMMCAINQRIANMSTEVYLSASGIVFKIKG